MNEREKQIRLELSSAKTELDLIQARISDLWGLTKIDSGNKEQYLSEYHRAKDRRRFMHNKVMELNNELIKMGVQP